MKIGIMVCGLLGAAALTWMNLPQSSLPAEARAQNDQISKQTVHAGYAAADVFRATEELAAADQSQVDSFEYMIDCLQHAHQAAQRLPAYTATLEQHVHVGGVLREPELLDLKFRRSPFSVYLKWQHDEQEALYIDGENDGRILVRPTRGVIALRGTWRLRPDSSQAMKGSRYPITELGLERLCERVLRFYEERGFSSQGLTVSHRPCTLNGVGMICFEILLDSPRDEYSRSYLTYDPQRKILMAIENYGWASDGRPGELAEKYIYHDFEVAPHLTDDDFDHNNPEYKFVRQET